MIAFLHEKPMHAIQYTINFSIEQVPTEEKEYLSGGCIAEYYSVATRIWRKAGLKQYIIGANHESPIGYTAYNNQ
jgi:hypothetical protein